MKSKSYPRYIDTERPPFIDLTSWVEVFIELDHPRVREVMAQVFGE